MTDEDDSGAGSPGSSRALKQALDDAALSEARFRMLTQLTSHWYWEQDSELRFVDTRARSDERGGISASQHLGRRRWELPDTEPLNTTWAEHQALLVGRQPFYDLVLRRGGRDGKVHYVKVSGAPKFDRDGTFAGYHGVALDITEEHRAATALRDSETRSRVLAEMVERSTDAIFARNLDGRISYWNAGAERLYGYTAQEAMGQPLRALHLSELSDAELAAAEDRLRRGARQSFEARRKAKGGEELDVMVSTAPLRDAQGVHVGEVYVVRDISAEKRSAREMQQAREVAEAANRAKSEFLANMSHEIRTPLNGILGMTRLVLDGLLDAEQRQLLSLVVASGNALANVINDILDFSKIEAGKLDIDRIEFQPQDLVPDIVRTLATRAQEKGVALLCQVAPDTPQRLVGDPGRLRQVLLNLVGNALKFTERGEVEVTLAVEAREDNDVVLRIGVRDTGIGIPAHQQRHIFDAFVQGDSGTTRRYGGTGLGLTISARLVELMGGRIGVESEPGRGSRFFFTLRCGLPSLEPAAPPQPEVERLHGVDVLVIEDNATYREVLVRILGAWGMTPHASPDGETGLALMERARLEGHPFALVLLDLMLPGLDGFAVAEAIRRHAPDTAAVMMLTANGQRGDAARCRDIGIRAYMTKPIRPAELFNAIVTSLVRSPFVAPGALITRHSLRERQTGARILLAEDNEVNRVLAMTILERLGHRVTVAVDGSEAVERCVNGKFDLVLMDMQMPVMDGLQATAQIRALDSPMRRVPVIALTANALRDDRDRCLSAGMDDYLPKPFNAEQLAAMIDQWLAGRASGWAATAAAAVDLVAQANAVLDTGALEQLRKAGGADGAAFVERIVGGFLAEAGQQLDSMHNAVVQADAKALRHAAHTLKSSSAAVGATQLSQLCRSLEFGAAAGELESIPLLRIEQAITRVDQALRAALPDLTC
jgi:two-component system, sensor histidine kinase and response regulator